MIKCCSYAGGTKETGNLQALKRPCSSSQGPATNPTSRIIFVLDTEVSMKLVAGMSPFAEQR